MKILVLTQQYPTEDNLYKNMFVHSRLIQYKKINKQLDFEVFVPANKKNHYKFEGISVSEGTKKDLAQYIATNKFDKIVVHFLTYKMIPILSNMSNDIPILIWVHGYEALNWRRRLFNAKDISFVKYILGNVIQLAYFRCFLKKVEKKNLTVKFIFISKWMKNVAEEDLRRKIKNSVILPNGIDTEFFSYVEKKEPINKNILLIRPFNSRKYATDIAVKSIEILSRYDKFSDLSFTIIGEGKYMETDISRIKKFPNVKIIQKFLSRSEIKAFHKENGIFLCPTRQDAQGVSMCEAMSSGLVPITSNNTAIPEFVEHNHSGFLTNNAEEIAKSIIDLSENYDVFEKMTKKASTAINEKCNAQMIINEEINLILNK